MYKQLALVLATTSTITLLIPHSSFAKTPESFQMPSGNIYCQLIRENSKKLRCEIASFLNPLPSRPKTGIHDCDWGVGFLLPASGKPKILCVSDTIANRNYKFSYGSTWINSGFKCISRKTGLTCTNTTGNGFFLSREKWRVF